jgi:hypothetical protein
MCGRSACWRKLDPVLDGPGSESRGFFDILKLAFFFSGIEVWTTGFLKIPVHLNPDRIGIRVGIPRKYLAVKR